LRGNREIPRSSGRVSSDRGGKALAGIR
jgi:hypothetical protein